MVDETASVNFYGGQSQPSTGARGPGGDAPITRGRPGRSSCHSSDAAIRGYVFWSIPAPVLRKELLGRCAKAAIAPEWQDVLRDLDRLQEAASEDDGLRLSLRAPTSGCAGKLFKTAGVALAPGIRHDGPCLA